MLMTIQYLLYSFFYLLKKSVLESDSLSLISWVKEIFTKANSDKFQAICIGKKTYNNIETFRSGDTDIRFFLLC